MEAETFEGAVHARCTQFVHGKSTRAVEIRNEDALAAIGAMHAAHDSTNSAVFLHRAHAAARPAARIFLLLPIIVRAWSITDVPARVRDCSLECPANSRLSKCMGYPQRLVSTTSPTHEPVSDCVVRGGVCAFSSVPCQRVQKGVVTASV